jgi:hypothetical protein
MHSHPAEVVAEARLHEGTRGRIERLTGRAQNLMDNGWHRSWFGLGRSSALQAEPFCTACSALSMRIRCTPTGTLAL